MEVSESINITQELVNKFANLSGDTNPLHLDKTYAKNSIFGKPIAHGMLLSSFFSALIAQKYPGPGSIYLSQSLQFLKPCYIGETIKVVIKLNRQEGSKYFLNTFIYNTNQEILIKGDALILKK